MAKTEFRSIDQYVKTFPASVQETLEVVRRTIHKAVPGADEAISYQIPVLNLLGPVFFFAAWKDHYSLYPVGSLADAFADELSGYDVAKGTIKFPYTQPVPVQLIAAMAKHRAAENIENAAKKGPAKRRKE